MISIAKRIVTIAMGIQVIMAILLFACGTYASFHLLSHIQRVNSHDKTIHYPASHNLGLTESTKQHQDYLTIGKYSHRAQLNLVQKITRKKFNNFVFTLQNSKKIEITFVDLTHTSILLCNFFSLETGTIVIQEEIRFKVEEDLAQMNMNLNIEGQFISLNVYQTKITERYFTHFNISIAKGQNTFKYDLTHELKQSECFTANRNSVLSYKCLGSSGSAIIDLKVLNPSNDMILVKQKYEQKQVSVIFDGLRGSGIYWRWVWGVCSGFVESKGIKKNFGVNIGNLFDIGQDLIYFDNKFLEIKGIEYLINQNSTIGSNITFRAQEPRFELNFTISTHKHNYKYMVVAKQDMVKFEGFWSGWIIQDQQTIEVKGIAGLVEAADGVF